MSSARLSDSRLRIVVSGLIAQYPLGGVTWDYLQYLIGLARLGHDVYYVEDTGQWPYNPAEDGVAKGCAASVAHLAQVMDRFDLSDRWAYRFAWQDQWFGLDSRTRAEVLRTADLVVNISGVLRDPTRLDRSGTLVYVDSDPVFTQVKLARGQRDFRAVVDAHDAHFTFGETLGANVPPTGHHWLATRQPIVLDEWTHGHQDRGRYTTVMNWSSSNDVELDGRRYRQKDVEFRRFLDLPASTTVPLEVAMASGKNARAPYALLRRRGWRIVDPAQACPDLDSYRQYLQTSRGEWSVAKNAYVEGRSGWFSCRSACYLAAGRPVVAQDTGFGGVLPVGTGLLAFSSLDTAVESLERVESDYTRHADAAREIAVEYFDSARVLASFIERALDGHPARSAR